MSVAVDLFAPVILSVSILPNPVTSGESISVRVEATDAARLITSDRAQIRLQDGKLLCVRRDSVAVEYESTHTGAEYDQAVEQAAACAQALEGLEGFLAQVVGVPV